MGPKGGIVVAIDRLYYIKSGRRNTVFSFLSSLVSLISSICMKPSVNVVCRHKKLESQKKATDLSAVEDGIESS